MEARIKGVEQYYRFIWKMLFFLHPKGYKNTFLMQEAIKAGSPFSMILKFHYICTKKSIREYDRF